MAAAMVPMSIFNTAEFSALPQELKNRLDSYLDTVLKEKELLKSNLEKTKVNFEQQYFEVENQLIESNSKLENDAALNRQLKEQLTELEKKYASEKLKNRQESQDGNLSTKFQLTIVNEHLEFEKLELTSLLEKSNREIDNMNEELKLMSQQVFEMNTAKCEALAKLDEIKGSEVSREFQVKRLKQEVQNLEKQIEWLNQEMNEKTKEFMTVKIEKSTTLLDVQSQLEVKIEECSMQQIILESQRKLISDQALKIDSLIQRIKDIQDTNIQSEEQYKQEIQTKVRLADLYKTSALEAESKSSELVGAVTELQKHLRDAAAAHTEMENEKGEEIQNLKEEIEKREHNIENLKQELVNANDLLSTLKFSGVSEDRVEAMFPTAAATSKILKSGLPLTQLYNEYVKSSELLILEEENKRLNTYLDQILQEIEKKAPMLKKQREDYEIALKSIDQRTRQLDGAMLECQTLKHEADENHRKSLHLSKENQKQKQQIIDLSVQVKYLVKEMEELRGGRRVVKGDISSLEISTSSNIISERLVTFGNIDDLQEQNQRLLTVIRELSEKQEMEESSAVDSKTQELREQLDQAKEELAELKESCLRQTEMVESFVQQRDMYRVLLQQVNSSPSPISSSMHGEAKKSASNSILQSPDTDRTQKIEETKEALKQLQEELMSYKKEKLDNEKVLNEQLDKVRQENSDLRVQNAQLASQLDFASEKNKVLQGNIDGYKKEIALLREKLEKSATSLAKHEQSITSLRQELMSCQEQLSQAQTRCENLHSEKELIRSSEQRLHGEIDHMRRERQSQTVLIGKLQAIQRNLETSENETKYRLNKQIEALEREKILLTKKLEMEEKQQASLTKNFESTKEDLNTCNQELQETKQQLSTVTTKLINAEASLKKLSPEKSEVCKYIEESDDLLRASLSQTEAEVDSLKIQLLKAEQHLDQYKNMTEDLEQTIIAKNEASDNFKKSLEDKLFNAESERNELKIRTENLEKERQELLNENIRITEEFQSLNAELSENLATLQNELQEALELRETAKTMEMSAKQDCAQQAKLAADAQEKYERELMLHSSDVEELSALKKQKEGFAAKLLEKEEQARKAKQELIESKASFEQKEMLLKEERDKMAARVTDLMQETQDLHLQMGKFSNQVITVQEELQSSQWTKPGSKPVEDEISKSSEQFLEVVRYLRKERDIAEGKIDVIQTECARLNQHCDMLVKQLELANADLTEEQQKLQADMQTAAQHAELMHRLESYNLLQDSNKLLREDRDHLQVQLTQSEIKLNKSEEALRPLQSEIRDLLSQNEGLLTDKMSLMAENERWKNRTNQLIDQSHKTDPEENKRLVQDREELRKHVLDLTDELHKTKRQSSQLKEELSKQREQLKTVTEEKKKVDKELAKANEEKENESNEKAKTIIQLKKIGRRYKEQAESVTKQFDDYKAQKEEEDQKRGQQQVNNEFEQKFNEATDKVTKLESSLKDQANASQLLEENLREVVKKKEAVEQNLSEFKDKVSELEEEILKLTKEKEELSNKIGTDLQQQNKDDFKVLSEEKVELEKKLNRAHQMLKSAKGKLQSMKEINEKLYSESLELKKKISEMDGETMLQTSTMKKEFEGKIQKLEQEITGLQKDKTEQQNKIQQLQSQIQQLHKQIESNQKNNPQPSVPVSRPVGSAAQDRTSSAPAEAPKTANIRPIASSPASNKLQTVPVQPQSAGPKVTASIRPMAIAPTSASPIATSGTPTATVMPTTVTQQDNVIEDEPVTSIQQLFPQQPSSGCRPTQQVQRVIPTQESSSQENVPEAAAVEMFNVEPQQSTSRETPIATVTQSLKRLREESESPVEDGASKRTKVSVPEVEQTDYSDTSVVEEVTSNIIPSTEVGERVEQTEEDSEQQADDDQEKWVQQQTGNMQELHDVKHTTHDIIEIVDAAASQKELVEYNEVPEEDETSVDTKLAHRDKQNQEQEEEEERDADDNDYADAQDSSNEDAVIIVGSDDEDEDVGNDDDDDEEDEDSIEEQMGSYVEDPGEDVDIYEDIDGEMGQGGFIDDQDDEMHATADHSHDDDVVIIDEDDDAVAMDSQEPESQAVSHSSLQTSQQTLLPPLHPHLHPERQLSAGGRNQLTPFTLGGNSSTYEDFDDCTVPSTPTLFHVPRQRDGFAEAVSSPQVIQNFVFGSGSESNLGMSGLSQLDASSVLGMGMDDTRVDLSQLEEGSSRRVPSTPSHSSGLVTIVTESLDKGTSQSDIVGGQAEHDSAVEGESREVQYEDDGEGAETEEGDHEGEHEEDIYSEEYKATGDDKSQHDAADKEQSGETGEVSQEAASSTSEKSLDAGGKPKIHKIVWADPSPVPTIGGPGISASQPIQTVIQGVTQQFRPVQGGPPRGRIHQSSSRGGFMRGQRRLFRGRGTMGGYIRRPPMY